MSTQWKMILSVMLLIMTICAVFVAQIQRLHDDSMAKIIAAKSKSATLVADTLITELSKKYRNRIRGFTNPALSPSREMMIQAFADRDRERLLQLSTPLFAILRKGNSYFKSIGWILPDNHVFLRLNNPDKFGNDISRFRPDVAAVNREKHQLAGFNVGIGTMQYRIVQPVMYHDQYVGAVQFGLKANVIIDELQDRLNTIAGMAVLNTEYEEKKLTDETPALKCRTHTIHSQNTSIFEPIKEQLDWNKTQQMVDLNGRPHVIINALPMADFQNDQLGVFFVVLDISEELAQKRNLLVTTITTTAAVLLFSFLILYFSYGSLVQKNVTLDLAYKENNRELEKRTVELSESKIFLEGVLENIADGIVACDKEGILSLFNRATKIFHGVEQKRLQPEEWAAHYDLYHADGKTAMSKENIPLFRAFLGEEVNKVEMVIAPKQGKKRTLLASGRALIDDTGLKYGAVVSMHDITERKKADNFLKRAHEQLEKKVTERVKELNCLQNFSKIVEEKGDSIEEILRAVVKIIPPSWQYPEITCTRLILNEDVYLSENFFETKWVQAQDIKVYGEKLGTLEVFYLEARPDIDEGPFIKEERNLINVLTERLGRTIERIEAEKKRKEVEEKREELIKELQNALNEVKTLRGILPICSYCKKIRDDSGYWEQVDVYIYKHSEADISHSICQDCMKKHYPE